MFLELSWQLPGGTGPRLVLAFSAGSPIVPSPTGPGERPRESGAWHRVLDCAEPVAVALAEIVGAGLLRR
ncbi:hypothetical protein HUO13_16295 [Saccharopolyspora erythraea]|uniref:hypothetical protein n=1 Tax=Saccharopolyspora erythraea TaxID=1836 RepID=UPI001BA8782C|nr:hypothetical protein [Saccharopolyspora erythraea]QUH02143.1 hypothetical protein HUO13_16295 [Saccharopolyspora erythraea]